MLARFVGFGRGDGHHLGAEEREHGNQHGAEHRTKTVGHEAAAIPQARHAADTRAWQQAEDGAHPQRDETDDGHHLHQRQPELELTVVLHAEQVGGGQQQGNHQRQDPDLQLRDPGIDDGGGDIGLDGDDQYPEPPVQPADGVAGPLADGEVGIGRERTGVRRGNGHFGQHAHHQHHQRAGQDIGQDGGGPCFGNRTAGADEQAGTDHAGNGQHGDMP
ncbi:hypothetical protein D3C79_790600 [compost metagenome]